ncbi:MAG: PAS domain S-box protein [Chloroflexi bacterium]|nr:PAS domain S-box protein [Chloroflexota bacterium]
MIIQHNLTMRQQAEETSSQTNSELQAIFQALPDLLLRLDDKGFVLNYQIGAASNFDLPSETRVKRRLSDIFPVDITQQIEQAVAQALQTGSLTTIEYALSLPQGEQSFEARVSPLFEGQVIAIVRNITEHRRSEQGFRQLLEITPEAMIIVNGPGEIVMVNTQTEKLFGYTAEELIGQSIETLLPEHFRGSHWSYRTRYMLEPYVRPMGPGLDLYALSKEGREFPVEINLSPMETGDGILIISSIRDITEHKRAEDILRESEQKYRSVVDSVKEVIFQTDVAGLWTFLNLAWAEITHFSVEESLGTNSFDYIHPDDRQWSEELHQALLNGDMEYCRYAARYLTKANNIRWLEIYVQVTLAADGATLGTSGTLNNITARKRAEQALLASETRFRALTTHAPVGIFQTDPQGRCIFVNNRWREITGLSLMEASGDGWANALHPDDHERIFAEWNTATQSGRDFALEYRLQTPEGKITWVFGNATSLRDEAGEIVGYLGTLTDITERRQVEILEKDRNQVLEMVSQNKPLKLVLAALIQLVERQYPELLGTILLMRDGRVYHGAAPNLPENFTRMIDGLTFGDILGLEDTVVYRGETIIIPDIMADLEKSVYHKLALRYELRAYWSMPIFSSDGALSTTTAGLVAPRQRNSNWSRWPAGWPPSLSSIINLPTNSPTRPNMMP